MAAFPPFAYLALHILEGSLLTPLVLAMPQPMALYQVIVYQRAIEAAIQQLETQLILLDSGMTAADRPAGARIQEDVTARIPTDSDIRQKTEYLITMRIVM